MWPKDPYKNASGAYTISVRRCRINFCKGGKMLKKLIGIGAVMLSVSALLWADNFNFDQSGGLRSTIKQASGGSFNLPVPSALSDAADFKPVSGAAYAFDSDVPPAINRQFVGDMVFAGSIKGMGVSKLHAGIFGRVDGAVYTGFFESRIKSIGMDNCGGGPASLACVKAVVPAKMWLTRNYVKFSMPQILRIEIMFHESRHTESDNDNWHHARCPTPFRDENGNDIRGILSGALMEGLYACDTTPYGSYGISLIMLKNIQKFCSNCTSKVRMDAGIYADDDLKRIINPVAVRAIREDLY